MGELINCRDGWVNADHVALVRERVDGKGYRTCVLEGPDGRTLGETPQSWWDLSPLFCPVVPAHPGSVALLIAVMDDEGRPTEKDIFIDEWPIIAWRISTHSAEPVFAQSPATDERVLICMPGGKLWEAEVNMYESLEAAKVQILQDAQRRWDNKHEQEQL
jgi:hypothetical protein